MPIQSKNPIADDEAGKHPMPGVPDTPPPSTKQESRLFQKHPGEKKWLTKKQAEDQGFYWKED